VTGSSYTVDFTTFYTSDGAVMPANAPMLNALGILFPVPGTTPINGFTPAAETVPDYLGLLSCTLGTDTGDVVVSNGGGQSAPFGTINTYSCIITGIGPT
jgi:hypothetical protein